MWGDPNITNEITLDSSSFAITTNLEAALRRMRLHDRSRILWAEAICINQQNIMERGCQVGLMGRIYSECKRVLVWLGDEEPGDEVAFSFANSEPKGYDVFQDCRATADEKGQENQVVTSLASAVKRSCWYRS